MFGDVAVKLLKLMGHTGTVPSAILPADIPEALRRLQMAVAADELANAAEGQAGDFDELEESDEPVVSLRQRAFPLIQLLEAAARERVAVMWDS